jgi:transposase
MESISDKLYEKYQEIKPRLNERARRLWAASEAKSIGRGGLAQVSRATGLSPNTIKKGLMELEIGIPDLKQDAQIRNPGGGRKRTTEKDSKLLEHLEFLIDPLTRGDPMSPLRWTCKSTRNLATELTKFGHKVSHELVSKLLRQLGYSLKANKKTLEGNQHPKRNEQFLHINDSVCKYLKDGNPVISVDTKKKEVLGNFANVGKEWEPKGNPKKVSGHDFPDPSLDRENPYGIYDLGNNIGFVNIGSSHDTATFAVTSIRAWWYETGYELYHNCEKLLITADGGGSNGYCSRLWKWELQLFSNELAIPISVCHFPPGTSMWNKIEHRLFSYITRNWRAIPRIDYETVVSLIRATTLKNSLNIKCCLDKSSYPLGDKIENDIFSTINLKQDAFQGEWNYTISPNKK